MVWDRLVRLIRTIAALTVLAAWLPATSHCLLGAVDLMPINCFQEPHSHGEGEPEHSHDDCSSCSVVESGNYKLSAKDAYDLAFQSTFCWQLLPSSIPALNPTKARPDSGRAPPDLAVRWQFLTRTAIPGRAPAVL